jgi:hypothetical protein
MASYHIIITFPGDARLLQLTRAMQRFVLAEHCRATPLAHTNEPTQPAHLGWLDKYTSEKKLVTRYGFCSAFVLSSRAFESVISFWHLDVVWLDFFLMS